MHIYMYTTRQYEAAQRLPRTWAWQAYQVRVGAQKGYVMHPLCGVVHMLWDYGVQWHVSLVV